MLVFSQQKWRRLLVVYEQLFLFIYFENTILFSPLNLYTPGSDLGRLPIHIFTSFASH